MKYLRYLLYLIFGSLIVGGGFVLLDLIFKAKILNGNISFKTISIIIFWGLFPVIGSFIKYKKKERVNINGMTNNYLKLESKCKLNVESEWKIRVKEIMNYLVYDNQLFVLDYEEEDYLEYRTDEPINDIELKKRKQFKNRIIVEIVKNINKEIEILVHKENQISEFSNYDNEAVLRQIMDKIQEIPES